MELTKTAKTEKNSPSFEIMVLKLIFPLLLLSNCIVKNYAIHVSGCSLDVSRNTNGTNRPVFINFQGEMVIPKTGSISLARGKSILLLCPGSINHLNHVNQQEATAICEGNNIVRIGDEVMSFTEISCKRSVRADVRKVSSDCKGHGNTEIAFKLDDIKIPLIRICYDYSLGTPIYTRHYLQGHAIQYSAKPTAQTKFSTAGIPPDVAISASYQRAIQKARFSSLLSSALLAQRYIQGHSYLATGHLSPKADFVDTNSQRSTFSYMNACHQWQSINNGNWKSVEHSVRQIAIALNRTLEIITGTYGILSLPDKDNKMIAIILQNDKIPVPKFIWKVVYDPRSHQGIALIVYNSPFPPVNDQISICQNICSNYGWSKPSWDNYNKGYIFCCEVPDLLGIMENAPTISVRGVLPKTD